MVGEALQPEATVGDAVLPLEVCVQLGWRAVGQHGIALAPTTELGPSVIDKVRVPVDADVELADRRRETGMANQTFELLLECV